MIREEHMVGDVFSYRFPGKNPDHALLVMHGIASHGGIYDNFGAHYSTQGAEVWCMDAPGHGRSCIAQPPGRFEFSEWVDAAVMYGEHIKEETGLPVVIKGSSLGAAAAYCALQATDVFPGAVLMGFMIPSGPLAKPTNVYRSEGVQKLVALLGDKIVLDLDKFFDFDEDYGYKGAATQKKADPYNTWFYDLASWASVFTYDPVVAMADNEKPVLFTVGEHDPTFPVPLAQKVVNATGGPVDFHIEPDGTHQLMLFHTEAYTEVVSAWVRNLVKGDHS